MKVWTFEDKEGKASRTQIPFILAWSLTIHKIQGATLDYAICNLGNSIFCPGQAYVSISRVRTLSGLFISELQPEKIKVDQNALEYLKKLEMMRFIDNIIPSEEYQKSGVSMDIPHFDFDEDYPDEIINIPRIMYQTKKSKTGTIHL
jgi:hypothetical protein